MLLIRLMTAWWATVEMAFAFLTSATSYRSLTTLQSSMADFSISDVHVVEFRDVGEVGALVVDGEDGGVRISADSRELGINVAGVRDPVDIEQSARLGCRDGHSGPQYPPPGRPGDEERCRGRRNVVYVLAIAKRAAGQVEKIAALSKPPSTKAIPRPLGTGPT